MVTLVIETATTACSVALIADGAVVARAHDVLGRGHAEQLVPMIATLPGGGRATHILVDCGPGSFTGIRVGIAAARGLSLGWNAEVASFSSLALVAAGARNRGSGALAVVLEGGHGEMFVQCFSAAFVALGEAMSLRPEAALRAIDGRPAIGNGVARLAAIDPSFAGTHALPDAADAIHLPARFTALPPRPIYGRAPDAKPPAR